MPGICSGGHCCLFLLSLLENFPISGGAGAAATGRCLFKFANEKLGQVSRKLLKDMFSNLAVSAWARHSALTGSPALSQEPGMALHGAGGDKKGGLWGQHSVQVWLSHVMCITYD